MSESLGTLINELETLAAYDGPWSPLRDESDLLKQRIAELRERETRLDDLLVIALVGGSGVGKSTLLNALAGDELAETSEFRPCTAIPAVYHPPGARLDFPGEWRMVSGSALEHLVIVDTPDSDTIVTEHRELVAQALSQCDLVFMCGDAEKYLDDATWKLLRPLRDQRTLVCIETKASDTPSVEPHWKQRLAAEGFEPVAYFRVNSRRTFDRKLRGGPAGPDEYDFAALEEFLREELTRDRIRRIKRSNAAGLLTKTVSTLEERLVPREEVLRALGAQLDEANLALTKKSLDIVRARLFSEPHLWTYALGREVSLRAKGFVQTVYRLFEAARTIPARMAAWSFLPFRGGVGSQAASLLTAAPGHPEEFDLTTPDLKSEYDSQQSAVSLEFARAGFRQDAGADGFEEFHRTLGDAVSAVLRGPARERIESKAQALTRWLFVIVLDLPALAFFVYTAYAIVTSYFRGEFLGASELIHAAAVLAIILFAEIFLLSALVRFFAWQTRRAAVVDLRTRLVSGSKLAFQAERDVLQDALARIAEVRRLRESLREEAMPPSRAWSGLSRGIERAAEG